MFAAHRAELDAAEARRVLAQRLQHRVERFAVDGIVAVGDDNEQEPAVRVAQQVVQQRETCAVGPLQIVDEEDQRVFGIGEHADKAAEDEPQAMLHLGRAELGHRRLLADDQLDGRNDVDDELPAGAKRSLQLAAARLDARFALAQDALDELAECQGQRRVWHVAALLVELAGNEVASARDDRLM